MNAEEYIEKFGNKNYNKLSYYLNWINFNGEKCYIPNYPTDCNEFFLDNNNNFLKIHYPYVYCGSELVIHGIIYNKILER